MTAANTADLVSFIDALSAGRNGRALFPYERRMLDGLESGNLKLTHPVRHPGKSRIRMLGAAFRYGNAAAVPLCELQGAALAWAVAIVEGHAPRLVPGCYGSPPRVVVTLRGQAIARDVVFRPDRDWATAGPLLEQWAQSFGMARNPDKTFRAFSLDPNGETMRLASGPTLLVAACRARVRNVFGDVVHVPEALL